jgi:hypothetical protein
VIFSLIRDKFPYSHCHLHTAKHRITQAFRGLNQHATYLKGSSSVVTDLLADVVVSHPLAPSHRRRAATGGPNAVAVARARKKHKKYDNIAARHGATFFAFATETSGGLVPEAMELLERIARGNNSCHYRRITRSCSTSSAMLRCFGS